MASVALTTFDNPFNPFTQFDSWFRFDNEKGYGTVEYLGRIAKISNELSDEENDQEAERAIDRIVELDPFNMYKKVKPSDYKN